MRTLAFSITKISLGNSLDTASSKIIDRCRFVDFSYMFYRAYPFAQVLSIFLSRLLIVLKMTRFVFWSNLSSNPLFTSSCNLFQIENNVTVICKTSDIKYLRPPTLVNLQLGFAGSS